MKLTNIALIAATARAGEGSGDDYATESSVTESGASLSQQTDGAIQLEHRSIFGNSPFAAIFASLDKQKKEKKPKNDSILSDVASEVNYEDLDEYEGELEGFDIEQFRESEAVNRVLNQAMFQQANFQRGQSGGFGGINSGPNSPGVAQSTASRVEVLMKMIMYLQVYVFFQLTPVHHNTIILVIRASISSFNTDATASQMVKNLSWAVMARLAMVLIRYDQFVSDRYLTPC